jgi:hypothetical protein
MSPRTAENHGFLQSVSLISGNLNGCCFDLVELTQIQYEVTTVKLKICDNLNRTDCSPIRANIFTCCNGLEFVTDALWETNVRLNALHRE